MYIHETARAAALLVLAIAWGAAADTLVLGDFSAGRDGFDGALAWTAEGPREGAGCVLLSNGQTTGWVETGKDLTQVFHDFSGLRITAKSTTAKRLGVRLRDSTGQEFLTRLRLDGTGRWEQLSLANPAPGDEHWGGANDGQWHPPATRIQFILEGGVNDVRLGSVEATLQAKPIPAQADRAKRFAKAKATVIGDFEKGVDAFAGTIVREAKGGKVGKACASITNPGEPWVGCARDLPAGELLRLSLWASSTDTRQLAVRLTDSTGQSFQHRLAIEPNGLWQELRIEAFADGAEAWGGAGDKLWHGPATRLDLILEAGPASVRVDGVTLLLAP